MQDQMRNTAAEPPIGVRWTLEQVARRWQCSPGTAQRALEGQAGVLNLGTPKKKMLRVPWAVLAEVEKARASTGLALACLDTGKPCCCAEVALCPPSK